MKKKKSKKCRKVPRDIYVLMHIKGELNLATKSESTADKKYSRKEKHKGKEVE